MKQSVGIANEIQQAIGLSCLCVSHRGLFFGSCLQRKPNKPVHALVTPWPGFLSALWPTSYHSFWGWWKNRKKCGGYVPFVSDLSSRPMIVMFRVAMKLKLGAPFWCDKCANSHPWRLYARWRHSAGTSQVVSRRSRTSRLQHLTVWEAWDEDKDRNNTKVRRKLACKDNRGQLPNTLFNALQQAPMQFLPVRLSNA